MILVFDAQCLVCSRWVRFLLRHDRRRVFRYASMQGATGRQLLHEAGLPLTNLQTLLLIDAQGRGWQHTAAILRVLHALGWPWRLAWVAWCIPALLRDAAYRLLARNRYAWFGRSDACFLPAPADAALFLD